MSHYTAEVDVKILVYCSRDGLGEGGGGHLLCKCG